MKRFYTQIFLERYLWWPVLKMDLIEELGDRQVMGLTRTGAR